MPISCKVYNFTIPSSLNNFQTKITKNALYLNINLHCYSFLHCDSKTKAGSVAFYIKESLLFNRWNDVKVELPLVEDMWIEIKTNCGPVVVGVAYIHSTNYTCDCEKFSENLFKIFYELDFEKFPFYILGDFNIDLNKVGESNFVTKHLHGMISSPGEWAIDLPAHITDHSKILIDHLYVNDSKHSYIGDVDLSNSGDHCGNFLIIIAKQPNQMGPSDIKSEICLNFIVKSSCKTRQMTSILMLLMMIIVPQLI